MTSNNSDLILVRHAEVAARYHGVCYGQSDIELSSTGVEQSESLAGQLAELDPAVVIHSGLKRTQLLAEFLANRTGAPLNRCDAIRERNFGDWELQSWDEIYKNTDGDIDRMVTEPESFRPPAGETTFEMRDRVVQWFQSLPQSSLVVAITHGGPIAALCGYLEGLPVEDWASRIPATGECVRIDRAVRRVVKPAQ
jgi:broad specificity phosphatase PhoE